MSDKPAIKPERLASIKSQVQFGARIDPKAGTDLIDEIERLQALPPAPSTRTLSVWEGPMPESNGKSNFTVILHRGDISEGICVYRSEYPDRARYEADCFRHLIGDPAFPSKPCILDYDADKHSGYVKPAEPDPSQPVRDFAAEVKQLCKDFSDLSDRPYMGDVTSAIDSLLEHFLETPS